MAILAVVATLGLLTKHDGWEPRGSAVVATPMQLLPDGPGTSHAWSARTREVPRDRLADLVLPRPAPRTTPEDDRTELARARDAQALDAWRHGDVEAALATFEAAVEADPDAREPHSDYGRLLALMTDYRRATRHLERAARLEPQNPRVWLDLATLYEREELFERAAYAKERAEALAAGRSAVRDDHGFWIVEGSTFP